ncbi:hypothetical protein MMPV_001937 [Pyropia vietnamensis]
MAVNGGEGALDGIPLVDVAAETRPYASAIADAMRRVVDAGAFILGPAVAAVEADLAAYVGGDGGGGGGTGAAGVATAPSAPATTSAGTAAAAASATAAEATAGGGAASPPAEAAAVEAIGVASGTDGLVLALMALGVGPGDEVVVPPFSWISTAEAVSLVGATVVFADIAADTYHLAADALRGALSPSTRAVIAVSLFGAVIDAPALRAVLDAYTAASASGDDNDGNGSGNGGNGRRPIALIEDGAQSFGGVSATGARSCCPGGATGVTVGVTSFFPTKPLGCYGDGGAVFVADPDLAAGLRSRRVHGRTSGGHTVVGLNGRLDAVQAAVVGVKLRDMDRLVAARRAAAAMYERLLSADGRVMLPVDAGCGHVYGVYTVRVRRRDAVAARLAAVGIATAVYYRVGMHQQPVYANGVAPSRIAGGSLPVAAAASAEVLSLPMGAALTVDAQERVAAGLLAALDAEGVTGPPLI